MIGDTLKKLRKDAKMTLRDMEKIIGVTPQHIERFEKGITIPKPIYLKKYAAYFNKDASALISESINNNITILDIDRFSQVNLTIDLIKYINKLEADLNIIIDEDYKKVVIKRILENINNEKIKKEDAITENYVKQIYNKVTGS